MLSQTPKFVEPEKQLTVPRALWCSSSNMYCCLNSPASIPTTENLKIMKVMLPEDDPYQKYGFQNTAKAIHYHHRQQ